jgi:hypothetical protein
MHTLSLGGTRIEISDDHTRITLPDGSVINGSPEDTDHYRDNALRAGYGADVMQFCIDHELSHVALAQWLHSISPTLEFVGNGGDYDFALRELEEDVVLALQRYTRAMNINLVERFSTINRVGK